MARVVIILLLLALVGCASPATTAGTQPTAAGEPQPTVATTEPSATATTLPTATHAPATPTPVQTATPPPTPFIAGLDSTLLLYTTVIAIPVSSDPAALWEPHWAVRTRPALPFMDSDAFDIFYGPLRNAPRPDNMSMYFDEFRPQVSPDGRYVLLPGLTANPVNDTEGTGTWLIDLAGQSARQLFPGSVIARWSPASDAITYVEGDTLYTLSVAEAAEPQPLFQHPDLWTLYANWSPDGRWIAALTQDPEPVDAERGEYAATYWLVPTNGDPARELTTQPAGAIEYSSREMSWSPDGQYLLMRNRVFDLEGNQFPDYDGIVSWLPNDARLLANTDEGLRIITVEGEEVARIGDATYEFLVGAWAFSNDGQHLAYTLPRDGESVTIAVYDLAGGESQVIGSVPEALQATLLRWSADDSRVIANTYRGDGRYDVWVLEPRPDGAVERVLEDAELIEVAPYPARL